ncbi:tetratricopeptide repeat protein [Embleya sp. NPDC008237]|uniref:tetratricopeptide repeat protein n=1 Tax=Embleya sp. NPDC008237 TaxID=3363978 RepID=UPI0036E18193
MKRPGRTPEGVGPTVSAANGGIAAGGDIANASTFTQIINNENAIVLPPEAFTPITDVHVLPDTTNVPRPGSFVGRVRTLETLDTTFARAGGLTVQVLHGLGGVGKSTLAAHWARTRCAGNPRWWITADSETAVTTGLADLAHALQPALTALPTEVLRERAVQWLTGHDDWLIVLDNVDRIDHIRPLLDRFTTGRFLITTRRATGWHTTDTLRLDVPDENEAFDLFTRVLRRQRPRDIDGIAEVCAELGHLPLALEQAAAYCAETRTPPRSYLDMLAKWPAAMYGETAEDHDPSHTIARVWRITLDRLDDTPLAGVVLRILAWYAPTDIPRNLLDDLAAPPALAKALGRLNAHSMITEHDGLITVHRLVQAFARTPDPNDPHRHAEDVTLARDKASERLAQALPTNPRDPSAWPTWRRLLPHVTDHTGHIPDGAETAMTARLLHETAVFLNDQGDTARAIANNARALGIRTRVLGEDDPDTLASRNNLAQIHAQAGNPRLAVVLHERTLADRRRVLGEDHPDTITSRNNLAGAYQTNGEVRRAAELFERIVVDSRQILGEHHPDTLRARNNLAGAYQAIGNITRAVGLYKSTLSDRRHVLGERHPDTLASRSNLASAYLAAGNTIRAIRLFDEIATDCTSLFGEKHPMALTARVNLAAAHLQAGNATQAVALFEHILTDLETVLVKNHPNVLTARNNLAAAYRAANNPGRAIPLLRDVHVRLESTLGVDNPQTLTARNNLGCAHQQAGNTTEAILLFETTLDGRARVLGLEHIQTLTTRNNLATAYFATGQRRRAIPHLEEVLTGFERALGSDHPSTVQVRRNLERARGVR